MRACQKNGMPFIYMKRLNHALNHKERTKSANRTAVSDSSFCASLGFHATMNRTDADFTL